MLSEDALFKNCALYQNSLELISKLLKKIGRNSVLRMKLWVFI